MSEGRVERRLAAILAADVVGYSRLIGKDEEGTLAALRVMRREVIDPKISEHRGRIVKTTGDGLLAEFQSVVDAVRCAAAWQAAAPIASPIAWRIGIHQGDIVVEGSDIFGDGVNVAARLEALAEPGGICVSARVQEDTAGRLQLAFEDLGDQSLKNIARPVRAYRVRQDRAASADVRAATEPALPDKPSIAVLPFENLSGDPGQEYFVDGMVEEITTAIARLPWLFVIARNSSFTYKGKAIDVKEVARKLGVRYVLEGSVRKAGNRVRITGQLIDISTGAHIWADRFDGALDDVFALQDQVAGSVAGAIEPRLRHSEIERARRKPTESLTAYDLYLRALAEVMKNDLAAVDMALSLARQALISDPTYAPAASLIAIMRTQHQVFGVPLSADEIAEAVRLARVAIDSGCDDADALAWSANALAMLAGDSSLAMTVLDRALALNPNSALAWFLRANVNCFVNRPEAAISDTERAMRLSPLDPRTPAFRRNMAYALMLAGRCDEAMVWVDRSLHDRPNHNTAIRLKVALCGYCGKTEEARRWIRRLLARHPDHTLAWFSEWGARFLAPGTLAVWVEGLRRAGLPER